MDISCGVNAYMTHNLFGHDIIRQEKHMWLSLIVMLEVNVLTTEFIFVSLYNLDEVLLLINFKNISLFLIAQIHEKVLHAQLLINLFVLDKHRRELLNRLELLSLALTFRQNL